jgi:type I restriction enzyme S subunit
MTLDTFFEKFDLFADAPNAVAKMRRFIIDLAVRGNIVPQSDKDEPADKLLARVEFEKARLIKAGEIKKQDPLPPVSPNAIPFTMPSGWIASQLGDVAVCLDYMRRPINGTERDLRVAGKKQSKLFPYYGATQQQGWIDDFIFDGELVLLGEDGVPFFDDLRTKSYLISGKTWVNNHAHVFRGILVSNRYLMHWLNTFDYTGRVAGTTRSKLNQAKAVDIPIALPPIAEQKRIVAKVDELMALCDRLEAQQKERVEQASALARASLARFAEGPTPPNLNLLFHQSNPIPPADLRKAILTLAVRGKLVQQDPKDEQAARVLERIDAAPKRAMRTRSADEGDGDEPTDFKPLYELPPGWEWAPFRRLPLHASVGLDRGRTMQGPDKAVGYFKMNNIRNSGGVDLSDLTRIDATPDEIGAFALADGDFLFNTRNSRELVGKTCVFRSPSSDPILNNNNILRVKFIDGFSPDFLDYWFRSPEGSAELEKLKSNTTNVCAIYQGKLSGFPCVVPPLAEQRRIVAKVDQLMALVDELETQLAASRATAKNLLEALVAELTGK